MSNEKCIIWIMAGKKDSVEDYYSKGSDKIWGEMAEVF